MTDVSKNGEKPCHEDECHEDEQYPLIPQREGGERVDDVSVEEKNDKKS